MRIETALHIATSDGNIASFEEVDEAACVLAEEVTRLKAQLEQAVNVIKAARPLADKLTAIEITDGISRRVAMLAGVPELLEALSAWDAAGKGEK